MFKLSFTNSIIIFFLLLSGADAAEVLTIKETVSGDFFGKREVALRAKYSCAIDENTDSYKFLLKALKIEGADLDDLTKTDILSVDSLKFIDELMLAKNKVESDLNDILCVQNNTGLVLHQYKGNSKNATNFGFLIISKYQFIKENNELRVLLPQNESKTEYWYSMGSAVESEIYHRVGIANKPIKRD